MHATFKDRIFQREALETNKKSEQALVKARQPMSMSLVRAVLLPLRRWVSGERMKIWQSTGGFLLVCSRGLQRIRSQVTGMPKAGYSFQVTKRVATTHDHSSYERSAEAASPVPDREKATEICENAVMVVATRRALNYDPPPPPPPEKNAWSPNKKRRQWKG